MSILSKMIFGLIVEATSKAQRGKAKRLLRRLEALDVSRIDQAEARKVCLDLADFLEKVVLPVAPIIGVPAANVVIITTVIAVLRIVGGAK